MAWYDFLEGNRSWVYKKNDEDPEFFRETASRHYPGTLFIGCSDARVPPNTVTGAPVGELFVHRNISNQVLPIDVSLSAGIQFAVEVLGVKDIVVCGHFGCGGVLAALGDRAPDYLEHWIRPLRNLARQHEEALRGLEGIDRVNRLVKFNVVQQVCNLSNHPSIRAAWASGSSLRLHGWVYDTPTGYIRRLAWVNKDTDVTGVDPAAVLHASEGEGVRPPEDPDGR